MAVSPESNIALLQHLSTFVAAHPIWAVGIFFISISLITRAVSGLEYRTLLSKSRSSPGSTRTVPILPYWIPWIGHIPSFALGATTWIDSFARDLDPASSTFALWMAGAKHNIVSTPSLAKSTLLDRHAPISMEPFIYYVMKAFWDDQGGMRSLDPKHLWGDIHGVLSGMMREGFVSDAIKGTVEALQDRTWNLVSGAQNYIDQSLWERSGKVQVISAGDSSGTNPFIAEASLHPLLREFVGDIATRVLMGHNFNDNNPDILADLWGMDSQFNMFLAGLPRWFPGMASAYASRERLIEAVREHHEALGKYLKGEDPGPKYDDMSDVSSVIVQRYQAFANANANPRTFATGDGAILWAMNVNANQIIFWLIWYIYSTPSLLSSIRREVQSYVKFRAPAATGLPISEAPKLSIDVDALWQKCPLLKGAFYETMRLEAASMSYKLIEADFVITESDDDAKLLGKPQPDSYLLRKGEFLCIPHIVHQNDDRYFPDPQKFDPRRFWIRKPAADPQVAVLGLENDKEAVKSVDADADAVRVDYGTMKVWGGGKNMCKGKTFAEREVVLFAAAILMQWEIVPVADGGKWVHPGRYIGAGAVSPRKDVRVRMWRREGW